jgi:hypothetical protein
MKIQKLTDLCAVGIELQKQDLPNGFINTVWVDKQVREKIYGELLANDVEHEYWRIDKKLISGYQFKVFGINFLIISEIEQ